MKQLLLKSAIIFFIVITSSSVEAQRYLTEVFTSTDETSNVIYGDNYSVLTGSPILESLVMDVYEPAGDTLSERPLIMLLHTGGFLPRYINQVPTGNKKDSATVELARRFAKMGYVVAVPDYRVGWNPQGTQHERTQTFIQAVYRGLQDSKSCVRWFRKDADQNGNSYGIDTNKIAVGGQGEGGYISLAYSSLNSLQELQLTKFFNFTTNAFMIDTTLIGNWDGFGGNPALNNSNHVGYSSEVDVVFNIGGAIGDSSWVNAGEVPVISLHGVADAFNPFSYGIVTVPGTSLFVVDVSGSSDVIRINNSLGNNDVFFTPPITDAYTVQANNANTSIDATYGNDANEGLLPFLGLADGNGPWEFWDDATVSAGANAFGQDPATILANGYAPNPVYQALGPVAGKARAMEFIDTIVGYTAPRLFRVLIEQYVNIDEIDEESVAVSIYPNPAHDNFSVVTGVKSIINEIELIDLMGKSHLTETQLNTFEHVLNLDQLPNGTYFVRITTANGVITRKLVKQ